LHKRLTKKNNNMKLYNRFILLVVASLLLHGSLYAQSTTAVRLLDEDTYQPITDLFFEYGSQSGTSDDSGTITFTVQEDAVMSLSHLSYGSWELSPAAVRQMAASGVYYRRSQSQELYPITVIAIRPGQQPADQVDLGYQDYMQHDAAAILSQTPGINSIQKAGNYGFDPVLRGFKYDQLNVVLNGAQSATAACPNRMDPPTSQMAPNMIDRIEVLKGPHALRYGTGLGATLNFVPTKLRFTAEPDVYGRLSTGFESNGEVLRGESQLGFSGKRYDLGLFAAWSQGNDYTAGDGSTVQADFQRGSFGANLGLKLADNQQLRVSGLYNIARDADFPALPMDLREDDTWLFNARHDIRFEQGALQSWNSTVFGSFVDHLMNNLLKPLDPRMLNAATAATTYNYGGRTEGLWKLDKGRLYTGADLRVEGASGTRVREFLIGPNAGKTFEDNAWQDGRIAKAGLFGEYQQSLGSYQLVLSTRLELNTASVNDASPEFTEVYADTEITQFNPSFSLGASRQLNDDVKMGLFLGRAQRSGSLTERFINYFPVGLDPFEMLGNPQLSPEVNYQADLTFEWHTETTALNIDVFASYLQDYISSIIDPTLAPRLPMSPGVRQFVNIDEVFKTGFEAQWTQQLFAGLQQQLGLAYTYAQDREREAPLPEIAPLDIQYRLQGAYFGGKLQPEVSFRHVLAQNRISEEFGETVTPAFSLVDLKLAYQFSEGFRLSAGVNNLLDEAYYEHLNRSVRGTNAPILARGRNGYVSLNVTF
jgi:iron complex outermembrane recepter protein